MCWPLGEGNPNNGEKYLVGRQTGSGDKKTLFENTFYDPNVYSIYNSYFKAPLSLKRTSDFLLQLSHGALEKLRKNEVREELNWIGTVEDKENRSKVDLMLIYSSPRAARRWNKSNPIKSYFRSKLFCLIFQQRNSI